MGDSVFINIPNHDKMKQLPIDEINDLQGDLKDFSEDAYQKLKNRILKVGYKYPSFVWYDKDNDIYYNVDSHGRVKTLKRMKTEGIMIPEFYPVIEIEAKDKKQTAYATGQNLIHITPM